jgi:hypothetical protein
VGGIVKPPEVEEEVNRRGYVQETAPDAPVAPVPPETHAPVEHEPPPVIVLPRPEPHVAPPGVHLPPPGVHLPPPAVHVPPEVPAPDAGVSRRSELVALGIYAVFFMSTKEADLMIPTF